jgi:hypothetical protein
LLRFFLLHRALAIFLYPFACLGQDLYHQFECISRLIKMRKSV